MIKSKYTVIGVMSGTSLDGIDLVYAEFAYNKKWQFNILEANTVSYPETWKLCLSSLTYMNFSELEELDALYSKYLATVIEEFIDFYALKDIDFIASHGHTALHQPDKGITYQIGNLQVLADELNQKIICDFRVQDVKLGGQGAPLVPIGDQLLFSNYDYCLNLGGFANISFEDDNKRIAFDICPVNIVLNYLVSSLNIDFDEGGRLAQSGCINEQLLNHLNDLSFYQQKPPKSLGLEWVQEHVLSHLEIFNLNTNDALRTFVEHIAIQTSKVIKKGDSRTLVTGGGAYNEFLINRIRHISISEIIIPDKKTIEFKEALIFGFLGVLKIRKEVNCLASVTGASKNHSSGKILIPKVI